MIINPEPTPEALNPTWALLNLICTIGTALIAIGMIATRKKKEEEEEEAEKVENAEQEEKEEENKKNNWKFLGLIPAIASIIIFLITEDMSAKMVMTDNYTLLMAVITLVNAAVAYFTRNKDEDEDKKEEETQAQAA